MDRLDDVARELTDAAYAAALDDGWAAWSERMIAAFGGAGGTFMVASAVTGEMPKAVLHAPVSCVADDYAAGYWALDPQVPFVLGITAPTLYVDTDHLDRSAPGTAEYMAWMNGRIGLDHYMTLQMRLADGPLHAGLSIHRAVGDGYTPEVERRRLRAMMPDIVRAVELGFRHQALLLDSFWDGVGAAGRAALLLDERGGVLRLSAAAAVLLGDGLDVAGGRLRCADASDDAAVLALASRVTGDPAGAGAARVRRRSGRAPLILTAYPLPRRRRMLAPAEAAALVTIVDPLERRPRGALYRQAFGLTAREAEVAEALAAGHSVESAAAMLDLAMPTARLHLRRLFAKTETTRQAELVRLLGRMG